MTAALARPILIVDENADQRSLLRDLLEGEGLAVVEAANGRLGLDYLTSNPASNPALIVLDLEMPVMSGWEILRVLRSYLRLGRTPVAIVSGTATSLGRPDQNVVARFLKPYEVDDLPALVRTYATGGPPAM